MDTAAVLRGISTVVAGEIVPLGRMPTPSAGDQGMSGPVRLEVYRSSSAGRDALDTVCLTPHGFDINHVDAVGHSSPAGLTTRTGGTTFSRLTASAPAAWTPWPEGW